MQEKQELKQKADFWYRILSDADLRYKQNGDSWYRTWTPLMWEDHKIMETHGMKLEFVR